MPPRERFTKPIIIDAAFEVVRRGGLENLSARHVAAELGASTAPIYRHFRSMEELSAAVFERSKDRLRQEILRPRHPDPLVSACLGIWRFQEEEPALYGTFALQRGTHHLEYRTLGLPLAVTLGAPPQYAGLSIEHRIALIERVFILAHGLALCFWRGDLPYLDQAAQRALVIEMVESLVEAFSRRPDLAPLDPKVRARG